MSDAILRPNGKPYRPRKPPRLDEFESYEGTGVIVVGTHDLESAEALAAPLLNDYDLTEFAPRVVWWRLVPWDNSGGFDRSWITDEVRGTPCVIWSPA